jgi:Na+-translocating ferredoxin:NAD+ oxidoreductase subunit C
VVEVGERVLKGQMIAAADGYISSAVHASSSGIVSAIGPALVPHISGLPDDCISIETDGRDEWIEPWSDRLPGHGAGRSADETA